MSKGIDDNDEVRVWMNKQLGTSVQLMKVDVNKQTKNRVISVDKGNNNDNNEGN